MRLRFGTRTMLAAFTVVILGLGIAGVRLQTARQTQNLVRDLRELGAYTFVAGGAPAGHPATAGVLTLLNSRDVVRVLNVTSDKALSLLPSISSLRQVEVNGPVTDAGIRRLIELRDLDELTIRSDKLGDEGVKHLSSLENLAILRLFAASISDQGLRHLTKLKRLRVLELVGSDVTDRGLQHLAALHHLEELNLSDTRITNDGLKHLQELRNLVRLEVDRTPATLGGVAHLFVDLQGRGLKQWFPADLYPDNRNEVTLKGDKFKDDVVPYLLSGAPEVTHLRLEWTDLTSEGVAKFIGFKRLRKLTLQQPGRKLTTIEALPNVERIIIGGLGKNSPPEMRRMPNLESICMEPPYAGNRIDRIARLVEETPKLVNLILGGTSISDKDVGRFQNAKQIEHLHLGRTQVTSRCLKYVSRMSNLVSLELWRTQVTDTGLPALLDLPRLQFLDLSETSIGDASIATFKKMPGLKELVLINTQITVAGQKEVRALLPQCKILFAGRRSKPWPSRD